MEACWHQNRIKINFVSEKAKSLWYLNSCYFLIKLLSWGQKNNPKSIKNHSEIVKMGTPLDMDFFSLLHVFSGPRRSRHPQNDSPKTPRWLPRRCQDASQTSKKLQRSLQDRQRCLQDGPRRAQDAPRGLPDSLLKHAPLQEIIINNHKPKYFSSSVEHPHKDSVWSPPHSVT